MNTCIFIGNLGQDPEKRVTQSGTSVLSINMAVTEKYKGESKTVWIPLTFWAKTADLVEQYCKKGSKLRVTCRFEMQDWQDKDGNKRQSPKFNVNEMEFLGDGKSRQTPQNQTPASHQEPPAQPPNPNGDFIESDIPF